MDEGLRLGNSSFSLLHFPIDFPPAETTVLFNRHPNDRGGDDDFKVDDAGVSRPGTRKYFQDQNQNKVPTPLKSSRKHRFL